MEYQLLWLSTWRVSLFALQEVQVKTNPDGSGKGMGFVCYAPLGCPFSCCRCGKTGKSTIEIQ